MYSSYKPYYLNMISMFILLMKSIKNGNKTYTLQMDGGHFEYQNDRSGSSFRHCVIGNGKACRHYLLPTLFICLIAISCP